MAYRYRTYRNNDRWKAKPKAGTSATPYKPKAKEYPLAKYSHDLGRALRTENTANLEYVMDKWSWIYEPNDGYLGYKRADEKTKKKIMYLMIKTNKRLVTPEIYRRALRFIDTEIYGHTDGDVEESEENAENETTGENENEI